MNTRAAWQSPYGFHPAPSGQVAGAASGIWTPLQLAGLVGFWRADLGVSQASGAVSAWADQSGHGYTLSPVGSPVPVWSATGFNTSFAGVTFSATGGYLATAAAVALASTAASLFLLVNIFNTVSNGARLLAIQANGVADDFHTPSGVFFSGGGVGIGFASNVTLTTGTLTNDVPQLIGETLDGINARYYVSSTAQQTGAFSGALGSSPNIISLGGSVTVTAPPPATCAYALLTSAAMSAGDIANLIAWTNANWGTSFT